MRPLRARIMPRTIALAIWVSDQKLTCMAASPRSWDSMAASAS
ncbi:hypothetical protein AEGHOMDF_5882 [Methylobacterium soli]|nr:hypothetical protein AEGHOMDF_5882 [Methylobacterium soli]